MFADEPRRWLVDAAIGVGRIDACEPEVHHPWAAVSADEDVLWLEVAMDQTDRMGRREPPACLHEHRDDLRRGSSLGLQPIAERVGGEELHRDPHVPVVGADVVDRQHVGMGDSRHRLGLAAQAGLGSAMTAAGTPEQLERDLALQLGVIAAVDHAHAAVAGDAHDDVATDRRAAGHEVIRDGASLTELGVLGDHRVVLEGGMLLGHHPEVCLERCYGRGDHMPPREARTRAMAWFI